MEGLCGRLSTLRGTGHVSANASAGTQLVPPSLQAAAPCRHSCVPCPTCRDATVAQYGLQGAKQLMAFELHAYQVSA